MCRTSPAFRVGLVPQNSNFGTFGLSGMGGAQCFMPASDQTALWTDRRGLRHLRLVGPHLLGSSQHPIEG